MKKIIVICLAIMMAASMTVSAFAAGGFVSSPSRNQAPELIKGDSTPEDCVAELIVTAYADRDQLSPEARQTIEEAYATIVSTRDLTTLNEMLAQIARERGIAVTDLAVSDMFDISPTHCDGHENHGHFDVILKADTLKNFVALLHFYDDEWHLVENAEVTNNGEHLEFDEDQFSPFAIVVSTAKIPGGTNQNEDDKDRDYIALIVCICSATASIVSGACALSVAKARKKRSR